MKEVKGIISWDIISSKKIDIWNIELILNSGLLTKKGHFSEFLKIGWHILKIYKNDTLSNEELHKLYLWYMFYREKLELLNINIPKGYIASEYNDKNILVFVDELITDSKYVDFEDKLLNENNKEMLLSDCKKILNKLVSIWNNKLNRQENNSFFLNCWVDFKPSNLHIDNNWKLFLFDLFVPKVREKTWKILYVEKIHRLSIEVLDFIHFNRIWIIYWFYYKLRTALDWTKPELLKTVKEMVIIQILDIFNWDVVEARKYIEILDINYRELNREILLNDYI